MEKYKEVYLKFFGYGEQDFVPCEVCNAKAVDIHHIIFRSQGGSDEIENLMGLCRECHNNAHRHRYYPTYLQEIHNEFTKRVTRWDY